MTPARWHEVTALFHAALAREPEVRAAFVDQACAADPTLRAEVDAMLAAHLAASGAFGTSADGPAVGARWNAHAEAPPLAPGTRIGVYRLDALIGGGGQARVYRGEDTTIGKPVALKVLPDGWLDEPDRRVRFEREARVLGALNHPHIATIHGLAEGDGHRALVLELVDGQTLADRVARGALPVTEALALARQIALALDAAHERGIIHRDLKPANIKIQGAWGPTPTRLPDGRLAPPGSASDSAAGTVKVLDFGLAKLDAEPEAIPAGAPTITIAGTREGLVMGTVAYMSPEQARGIPVDKRTDIWAFGCVLYEMLTGRQAFRGDTLSDTLAAVLTRPVDLEALPADVPPTVRRLLRRCLEKDVQRRARDIGDVRFELEEADDRGAVGGPSAPAVPDTARHSSRSLARLVTAASAIAALVLLAIWSFDSAGNDEQARVAPLTAFPGTERSPSLSPDGTQVVYSWNGESGDNDDIYVQRVGSDSPHRLTTSPAPDLSPAWSPDGRQIAFVRVADGKAGVWLIDPLPGGQEGRVAAFASSGIPTDAFFSYGGSHAGLAWSADSRAIAVSRVSLLPGKPAGLLIMRADGTDIRELLPPREGMSLHSPAFSPDGRWLAYAAGPQVELVSIDATMAVTGDPKRLTDSRASIGGLVWSADSASVIAALGQVGYNPSYLWRLPRDGGAPTRIEIAGDAGAPSLATAGRRLAFSRRDMDLNLVRVSVLTPGQEADIASSSFSEYDPSVSRTGRLAFATDRTGEGSEIFLADADGGNRRTLTGGAHRPEGSPRWSPDGTRVAFDGVDASGTTRIYVLDAEAAGSPARIIGAADGPSGDTRPSWSHDGQWIYFSSSRSGPGPATLWRVRASGGPSEPVAPGLKGATPIEALDGSRLYFFRQTLGVSELIMRTWHDQREQVLAPVVYWNYAAANGGLFYVKRPSQIRPPFSYEVWFFDERTGRHSLRTTVTGHLMSPGLGISPDGQTVTMGLARRIGFDLFRIDNIEYDLRARGTALWPWLLAAVVTTCVAGGFVWWRRASTSSASRART